MYRTGEHGAKHAVEGQQHQRVTLPAQPHLHIQEACTGQGNMFLMYRTGADVADATSMQRTE